jgi:hypothetical protein
VRQCIWSGVFPTGEDEECGAVGVGGSGVRTGDGMFHGTAHAFVVILWVIDVGAVPCVRGEATAKRKHGVFWVE